MEFSWDPAKRLANIQKHGVDFIVVYGLDWEAALIRADLRMADRDVRLIAILPLEGRPYPVAFVIRTNTCRIISVRRASDREKRYYAPEI